MCSSFNSFAKRLQRGDLHYINSLIEKVSPHERRSRSAEIMTFQNEAYQITLFYTISVVLQQQLNMYVDNP